ncbi:hypothetical protein I5695_11760 [Burkholderia cenocepacia]|nr:hypothetical protein [Burkholderia cenocepacia]
MTFLVRESEGAQPADRHGGQQPSRGRAVDAERRAAAAFHRMRGHRRDARAEPDADAPRRRGDTEFEQRRGGQEIDVRPQRAARVGLRAARVEQRDVRAVEVFFRQPATYVRRTRIGDEQRMAEAVQRAFRVECRIDRRAACRVERGGRRVGAARYRPCERGEPLHRLECRADVRRPAREEAGRDRLRQRDAGADRDARREHGRRDVAEAGVPCDEQHVHRRLRRRITARRAGQHEHALRLRLRCIERRAAAGLWAGGERPALDRRMQQERRGGRAQQHRVEIGIVGRRAARAVGHVVEAAQQAGRGREYRRDARRAEVGGDRLGDRARRQRVGERREPRGDRRLVRAMVGAARRDVEPQMRERAFERRRADQRVQVEIAHPQRFGGERRAVDIGAAMARRRPAEQVARRSAGRGRGGGGAGVECRIHVIPPRRVRRC